jgi:hypothetical protein
VESGERITVDAYERMGTSLGGVVGDVAAGPMGPPPPAAGDGGKFSFAPAEIEDLVKDWVALADGYGTSLLNAQNLVGVVGPGTDFASEVHAITTSASGQAYLDSLIEKREYCYSQAQKLQDALSDYRGVDRSAIRRVTAAGESSEPSVPGGI